MSNKIFKIASWKYDIMQLHCKYSAKCVNCNINFNYSNISNHKNKILSSYLKSQFVNRKLSNSKLWTEININERKILYFIFLVYMQPLISLISGAVLFNIMFETDLMTIFGGMIGGIIGFLLTKYLV